MMFSWNIKKSAEALLSRLAVKRLCKFLLKKKLGQFILGDIDLDQLDVQLIEGTIQLGDLALNVDHLNEKFGATSSVIIKEGSIGCLSLNMPWKVKGFQVEIDELELVLAPCPKDNSPAGGESSSFRQDTDRHMHREAGKSQHDVVQNAATSNSNDVHEGVKTVAKMVKWFLKCFHVKIKRLLVAFEPYLENDERKAGSQKISVLRICETECGTFISEDANTVFNTRAESLLGISQLTGFVKFQGAVLELLCMDYVNNRTCFPYAQGSSLGELFSAHCPCNATTPIVTGKRSGFSGNLKLTIPWKNGSLDICKVDADVCIDPVELRLQPSAIKWLLHSLECYKNIDRGGNGNINYKSTDSVNLNSSSHFHSSTCIPIAVATDKVIAICSSFSSPFSSLTGQESVSEAMLPGSHLIPDWVPNTVKDYKSDGIQEELDLGASVDQFFECLDGMRNSQSALGSSGMWNWTYSVFSALTAASSLASGSLHIPSEQLHVQTNLKATLAGISIMLSFQDEDQEHLSNPKGDQSGVGSKVNYLGAECKGISIILQVCPREMRFEGTVKYIEISDYSCNENDAVDLCLRDFGNNQNGQTVFIQHLQAEVQRALPPLALCTEDPDSEEINALVAPDFRFCNAIKIKLLSTSGVTHCRFTIKSDSSDGSLTGPISFSLQMPRFIFWVNFWSINMLLDLVKDVGKSVEVDSQRTGFRSRNEKHGLSHGILQKGLDSGDALLSSTKILRGNISIPNARVIVCFPFGSGKDFGSHPSWDQFIAIDFSSPSASENGKFQDTGALTDVSSCQRYTSRDTCSLHLNIGNLKIYLINPAYKNDVELNSCAKASQKFCAEPIFFVRNRPGCLSTVSVFWHDDTVTGPWVVERAKSLATSEESGGRKKFVGEDHHFATVIPAKDLEDKDSRTREEMISSSSFFFHIHLFPVTIALGSSQYGILCCLLDQMITGLSGLTCDVDSVGEASLVSQASFLLECEYVEIIIRPDRKEDIKSSLQNELPGSWHCLTLRIQKFSMLSVSNIGGIRGAKYFWLAHGEGKLWGSITGVPDQEFLLISCSNSTRKRGDGGGSNALSTRLAGSDIVHLWDPKNLFDITSITVKCGTIVAVGGRLDWLDVISSFFILPSPEVDMAVDDSLLNGDLNAHCKTSFILKLVDVGLSYEHYLKNSVVSSLHSDSSCSHFKEETCDLHVSCLLAASSLTLSNTTMEDSMEKDYKIVVQDLGLLICAANQNLVGTYSVEYLQEMGYVKVARESHVEANLRITSRSGLPWEIECSKSHIYMETCHDTTTGLIRLAAQLQQLFAPDLEEAIVHLQNRWNNAHQVPEGNEFTNEAGASNRDSSPSTYQDDASSVYAKSKVGLVGLMDEICEDAFHLNGNHIGQFDSSESQIRISPDGSLLGEACSTSIDGSVPLIGCESSQASFLQNGSFPELIEGYCLSDLRPLSELSIGRQLSPEILKCGDLGIGDDGWYGDACLSIVENHISECSGQACMNQCLKDKLPCLDSAKCGDFDKVTGHVLFKNINIRWRMYSGSDWHAYKRNGERSSKIHGRDTTACLELSLSGMQFQYDFFPAGGIFASKLSVSVHDFYLYDRSKSAPWNRVLGYYNSKDHPRESSSKAFKLFLEAVRPDPLTPLEEYRLHIAFLPMLLHLHQSQLDFLIKFFGEESSSTEQSLDHQNSTAGKPNVMKSNNFAENTIADEALLPYFQKFDIWPILLRVDYTPNHVDLAALRCGKYVELVNLVPWKGVELQLKHVHSVGVYGWGGVCETIIGEWLEDISQNQIRKILQGLPTIRSLVAVGTGAAKLVSLPVETYRKDKRILKGMQRGTIAFLRSISLEAVGLGVHLAAGAHDILLQAEYILASVPPPISWPVQGKTKANARYNQPKDTQQGIQQAYESLSDGLGKSASALLQTPMKKYQRGVGAGSVLATAVRAVPAAAIAPVSACASAAHCTLLGLRNSLDPERKKESMEKYLGPTKQHDWN